MLRDARTQATSSPMFATNMLHSSLYAERRPPTRLLLGGAPQVRDFDRRFSRRPHPAYLSGSKEG